MACGSLAFEEGGCSGGSCGVFELQESSCQPDVDTSCHFLFYNSMDVSSSVAALTTSSALIAQPTTAQFTNSSVPFSQILAAAGNMSLANAIATSKWVEAVITVSQARELAEAAIKQAGGFGVPCSVSVPLCAVPGLIMKTVPGVVYPVGFAVSIQTSAPSSADMALAPVISSVMKLTDVQSNSSFPVRIQISGFPLSPQRRLGSAVSRRASGCDAGTEWRYTKVGMPLSFACNCPANFLCSGETTCSLTPRANDAWMVVMLNSSVCAVQSTNLVIQVAVGSTSPLVQAVTPTPTSQPQPDSNALAIGLGVGLGLGLPAAALFIIFTRIKRGKEVPVRFPDPVPTAAELDPMAATIANPVPQEPVIFTAGHATPTLMFSSLAPSQATLNIQENPQAMMTGVSDDVAAAGPAPHSGVETLGSVWA